MQAYPKELMQCMLDVSSQTSEDPFYQRVLRLVKTLVRARAMSFLNSNKDGAYHP